MKQFSLFELLAGVTMFAIGISAGWLTRDYSWQGKLNVDANQLAGNTVTYYDYLPELGMLSVRHVETLDLEEYRQKQIITILFERNGLEIPNN